MCFGAGSRHSAREVGRETLLVKDSGGAGPSFWDLSWGRETRSPPLQELASLPWVAAENLGLLCGVSG